MNRYALFLAVFVARRRAELNITVAEAAHHAGISTATWEALESGAFVPSPHCPLINELAHVLDANPTEVSFRACVAEYNRDIDSASVTDASVACPFSDHHFLQVLDVAPSARANRTQLR